MVTVIMPVYNAEKYVGEAIQSVLNQGNTINQLVIINDGSNDKTLTAIEAFLPNPLINLVHWPDNRGLVSALNHGLSLSTTRFIARMDADDICLPGRLECQVAFLQKHKQVAVCGTGIQVFGANTDICSPTLLPKKDAELKLLLFDGACFFHPTVMFDISKISIDEIVYDPRFVGTEDYELWARLAISTKFANIPSELLKYRRHPLQVTAKADETTAKNIKAILQGYTDSFNPKISEIEFDAFYKVKNDRLILPQYIEEYRVAVLKLLDGILKAKGGGRKLASLFRRKYAINPLISAFRAGRLGSIVVLRFLANVPVHTWFFEYVFCAMKVFASSVGSRK